VEFLCGEGNLHNLLLWIWRIYVLPKRLLISTGLIGIISNRAAIFINIAVRLFMTVIISMGELYCALYFLEDGSTIILRNVIKYRSQCMGSNSRKQLSSYWKNANKRNERINKEIWRESGIEHENGNASKERSWYSDKERRKSVLN
jgi:hypothetical protein